MNYLTYLPVFDNLTKPQQASLTNSAFVRKFNKNEILHNGSQDCTGLILVLSGQLRAFTISDGGREITMYRLFERDICLFSASCIMNSIQFDITVTAEKDTEVLVIPSEIYKSIMDVSAPLANYTNEVMASRFSDVMWLIEQIMWKSFDKRLADFLLSEANIEDSDTLKITPRNHRQPFRQPAGSGDTNAEVFRKRGSHLPLPRNYKDHRQGRS